MLGDDNNFSTFLSAIKLLKVFIFLGKTLRVLSLYWLWLEISLECVYHKIYLLGSYCLSECDRQIDTTKGRLLLICLKQEKLGLFFLGVLSTMNYYTIIDRRGILESLVYQIRAPISAFPEPCY